MYNIYILNHFLFCIYIYIYILNYRLILLFERRNKKRTFYKTKKEQFQI